MANYVGARIQITSRDGKYEGTLHSVDPVTKMISIDKAKALPSGQKYLGLLNFYGQEITNLHVLEENELPSSVADSQQEEGDEQAHSDQYIQAGALSHHIHEEQQTNEVFDDYQTEPSSNCAWPVDVSSSCSLEDTISNQTPDGKQRSTEDTAKSVLHDINQGMEDFHMQERVYNHVNGTEQPTYNNTTYLTGSRPGSHEMKYTFINKQNSEFSQAMEDIKRQDAIGLVLKGVQLGRRGKLSIILVLCEDRLYMFDVVALGSLLFTQDLIDVLESQSIAKVIHDSRFVSDLLYHQYGILLANVFDTQVGDILIRRRQYMGDFPKNVSGTTECILEYLDISIQDIAMHLENTKRINEDESMWLHRPLSSTSVHCAYLDTIYLLKLREAITQQLMAEFTCAIDIYLSVERDRLEVDTKKITSRASYVPRELVYNLHRKVVQLTPSTSQVRPPELSQPSQASGLAGRSAGRGSNHMVMGDNSTGSGERWYQQQQGKLSSSQETYSHRSREQILPWKLQLTSQGLTAKALKGRPAIAPLMTHSKLDDEEEEDREDDASLADSQDSEGEAFGDCPSDQGHLWQHRYAANPDRLNSTENTASTSRGALTTYEQDMSYYGATYKERASDGRSLSNFPASTDEPGNSAMQTMQEKFDRLHSDSVTLSSPPKMDSDTTNPSIVRIPVSSAMLGPRGKCKRQPVSAQPIEALAPGIHEHSPQKDLGNMNSSSILHSALSHNESINAISREHLSREMTDDLWTKDKTLRLTDMKQTGALNVSKEVPGKTSSCFKSIAPVQLPSYADALSGRKHEGQLKITRGRTLKALGKALAAGDNLDDDKDDEDLLNELTSEESKENAQQSPSRSVGRGRASLLHHGKAENHMRVLPSRSPGGLTARINPRSVQVSFSGGLGVTDEQEGSAMNGCFLSQRAL